MAAKGVTRRRAIGAAALGAAGLALIGVGAGTLLREAATSGAYRELSERTSGGPSPQPQDSAGGGEASEGPPSRDWAALRAECGTLAAWVAVEGTGIDLPVVAAADTSEETWWLRHDLWGSWTLSGTPFIDHRVSGADDRNVVCYGHHLTGIGGMFSELQRVYEQGAFDALGPLSWETPAQTSAMAPLCALSVDERWSDIQTFDWSADPSGEAFRPWLAGIAAQATARTEGWEALCASASRCVALVTCSSDWSYQPWRTVAVWCA